MLLIIPALIPLMALAAGLEYLRRALLPQVEPTQPVAPEYTPPFEGGQCGDLYYDITMGYFFTGDSPPYLRTVVFGNRQGKLLAPEDNGVTYTIKNDKGATVVSLPRNIYYNISVQSVTPRSGVDNCGNLPNPNAAPSISSDGIADSPAIEIEDDSPVVEGTPIVPYNPLAAALAALLAALKAASDLKDAIDFIGDMLDKIGKGIDEVKDWLDDKDKNPSSGKDVKRHDYGSIRKDGFLRLFPSGEQNGFAPEYLDLQLLSIPIGYGKYFGSLSPNFYRFKSLGYISFVSPTFGVLETHEIEFSRTSLTIPPNAYGFFYHLGLEDVIRANVSLFYSIDKPEGE